jgi:hypothetical protein
MKFLILIVVLLCSLAREISAQNTLRLSYKGLFKTKIYNFYEGETIEFKSRGEHTYKRKSIMNMYDSSVVFKDYTEIILKDITAIKIRKRNPTLRVLNKVSLIGGIGFLSLNTINGMILGHGLSIDERALIVSGSLIGASLLLHEADIKRVRMTRSSSLKIFSINYKQFH